MSPQATSGELHRRAPGDVSSDASSGAAHSPAAAPPHAGTVRGFPPRSLLGAGLAARLAVAGAAVALLWLTVLWALD